MKRLFFSLSFFLLLLPILPLPSALAQQERNVRTRDRTEAERHYHLARRSNERPADRQDRFLRLVEANEEDSLSLVALYEGTFGSSWINTDQWLTGPLASWYGVSLDDSGRVRQLNLANNNLFGALPSEMAGLTAMDSLHLGGNSLAGTFPTSLLDLTGLRVLNLSNNFFRGPLPETIGQMQGLETLVLWGNDFSDLLPAGLWDLTNLKELALFSNQFAGTLSEAIGNLGALELLYLDDNLFSGPLPAALGEIPTLVEIFLDLNNFTGTIPASWATLSALSTLYLSDNELEGGIPDWIGDLDSLQFLSLSNNPLGGEIPESLGSLSRLSTLFLSNNALTGPFPEFLLGSSNLTKLYLAENDLGGLIPNSFSTSINLRELDISHNAFGGSVPSSIAGLTLLSYLNLSNNLLSDRIPPEWRFLENIRWVYLNNNRIQGEIPAALFEWFLLNELDLSHNSLTGEVPSWIGQARFIRWLDLSNNQLSGVLPEQWETLLAIEEIVLDSNLISGTIPTNWSALTTLKLLSLSQNNLTSLPAPELLRGIDSLDVRNNLLTFEDFETNLDNIPGIMYAPQKEVPLILGSDAAGRRAFAVQVGGTVNEFEWYYDNTVVAGEVGSRYEPGRDETVSDTVFARVTNSLVPELVLESERLPINLALQRMITTPDTLEVSVNGTGQVRAVAFGESGDSIRVSPTWTTTGGDIDQDGLYRAFISEGWYVVEARFDSLVAQTIVSVAGVATAREEALRDTDPVLSIFPNPVRTELTVQVHLDKVENIRWQMVDLLGRIVWRMPERAYTTGRHQLVLPVHTLAPGMYFIVLEGGNIPQKTHALQVIH